MRASFHWICLATLAASLAACGHTRGPEERTDDGLVRVASRAAGGVYRDITADFTPYKRIILEPPTVEFAASWREAHPEVKDADIRRIRDEAVKLFREEFEQAVVKRGNYQFTDTLAPDVLLVAPRVVDLDIPAPDTASDLARKTFTPGPVKMQVVGELRSAASNALLMRVIVFEGQTRYGMSELRLANRVTNAHEMRLGFSKWSRMVNEALNVAKASEPAPPAAEPRPD